MVQVQPSQVVDIVFPKRTVRLDTCQRSLAPGVEIQQVNGSSCNRIVRNGQRTEKCWRLWRWVFHHLLADSDRIYSSNRMREVCRPVLGYLVVGNGDRFNCICSVIEFRQFDLDPLCLAFGGVGSWESSPFRRENFKMSSCLYVRAQLLNCCVRPSSLLTIAGHLPMR